MSETRLIVGLGNPGKEYEWTRHNLGFLVVRKLAENINVSFSLSSFTNGLTAEAQVAEKDVCFLLPLTYMNHSGVAVSQALKDKATDPGHLLVVCDDFNLDFQQLRLRAKGSDGGHNGLTSVIEKLQTEEFPRLRLGIGKPPHKDQVVDYVLEEFSQQEKDQLDEFIDEAVHCCLAWLGEGISKSMERFNQKKE